MLLTILPALVFILAVCALLYAAVGLIQNNKLLTTPPKDIRAAAKEFFRRFFTQQFKRSCLPDGPKVGSASLSPRGDRRMPSDAPPDLRLGDLT